MFFGGGLIPYYFVVRALGMIDTVWVMIIPGAVGAYNVIIFRTFFNEIPAALRESAYIDGAGHYTILFRILLPISKPLLATFALFCMVGKWNDFFTALLFIRDENLLPIQMLLRKMLVLMDFRDSKNLDLQTMYSAVSSRTMKCAAVIITIMPIMCVYPFLQKYFVKGILVGTLKA
jgi:putative aldouronate transport system permease protein